MMRNLTHPDSLLICPDGLRNSVDKLIISPDELMNRPDNLLMRPDVLINCLPGQIIKLRTICPLGGSVLMA